MGKEKTYTRIGSVDKAFDILECIAATPEPMTGTQIAEGTGLKFQTVMGYLATMQDRGYVQITGGKYRIGMALAVFWTRVKSSKEREKTAIERDLKILNGE